MIILVICGLVLIGVGISAKLGYFRGLYLIKGIPGLYPAGYIFAFIPAGVGSLILATLFLIPNRRLAQDIVIYGILPLFLLAIILMIWQPRWLKPWWLIWLEDHYGHILEEILEEARNDKNFEQQTATETELAGWADRAAEKYGWRQRS